MMSVSTRAMRSLRLLPFVFVLACGQRDEAPASRSDVAASASPVPASPTATAEATAVPEERGPAEDGPMDKGGGDAFGGSSAPKSGAASRGDGKPQNLAAVSSSATTTDEPKLRDCVAAVFKKVTFPKPKGGDATTFTVDLVLRPELKL